jgi:hypothetical protein
LFSLWAPLKSVCDSSALEKSTFVRLESVKFAFSRLAPEKSISARLILEKSTPITREYLKSTSDNVAFVMSAKNKLTPCMEVFMIFTLDKFEKYMFAPFKTESAITECDKSTCSRFA